MLPIDIPILTIVIWTLYKNNISFRDFMGINVDLFKDLMNAIMSTIKYAYKKVMFLMTCCGLLTLSCCRSCASRTESVSEEALETVELQVPCVLHRKNTRLAKGLILIMYVSMLRVALAAEHIFIVEAPVGPIIRFQASNGSDEAYRSVTLYPEPLEYPELPKSDDVIDEGSLEDHFDDHHPTNVSHLLTALGFPTQDISSHEVIDDSTHIDHDSLKITSLDTNEVNMKPTTVVKKKNNVIQVVTTFDIEDYEDVEVGTDHIH